MTNLDTLCPSNRVAIRKSVESIIMVSALSTISDKAEDVVYSQIDNIKGTYLRSFTKEWSRIDISLRVGEGAIYNEILEHEMDAADMRSIQAAARAKAAKLKAERHAAYLASKK